jgi:hypothetical protein
MQSRVEREWLLTLRGDAVFVARFVARERLPRHEPDAYRLEIE